MSGSRPTQNNNNNLQHRNALAPNHNKGKKPMRKHDDNSCPRCGMNGHKARTCHTPKHFVDLYQVSIKGNGKRFEIHSTKNAYEEANIKVNNALIEDIFIAPINDIPSAPMEAKSLEVLNFFDDPDDKAKSLGWWKRIQT